MATANLSSLHFHCTRTTAQKPTTEGPPSMHAFVLILVLALAGPALCTPVAHASADRTPAHAATALHASLLLHQEQQQQHLQQYQQHQPLTLQPAHSIFSQRYTPASTANVITNPSSYALSLYPHQHQHVARPPLQTAAVAKATYEAYLIKPGDCQSMSTWCCGKKTVVKATCGGAESCTFTLSSVSTYNYSVQNGEYEDLTYSYWHIPVTICNTGEEGVVFVTTY